MLLHSIFSVINGFCSYIKRESSIYYYIFHCINVDNISYLVNLAELTMKDMTVIPNSDKRRSNSLKMILRGISNSLNEKEEIVLCKGLICNASEGRLLQ